MKRTPSGRKTIIKPPRTGNQSQRAKQNLLDATHIDLLRKADEIITLQHVIRRFRNHHNADSNKLLALRTELHEHLSEGIPENSKTQDYNKLYADLLWYYMGFLDSRENRRRLKEDGIEWALAKTEREVEEIVGGNFFVPVTMDMLDVAGLASILLKFNEDIEDIYERLNYTHLYSLLGLTSYISGEHFYERYINAKCDNHRIRWSGEIDGLSGDAKWLYTIDAVGESKFSPMVHTNCSAPLARSTNIQIFGGSQHTVSINNIPLQNRLVLSVPTNETPDRIDDAIREFREALMQEYVNNCGGYFNISAPEMDTSIFMSMFNHEPCLIRDWDQLQRHIVGLWVWDIANAGSKLEETCPNITEKIEILKSDLNHPFLVYTESTVHGYYEKTAKDIGPRTLKAQSQQTDIDRYLTRSAEIIGPIQQDRF